MANKRCRISHRPMPCKHPECSLPLAPAPLEYPKIKFCIECNRPLRPIGSTKKAYPGTLANFGHSMCYVHHQRMKHGFSSKEADDPALTVPQVTDAVAKAALRTIKHDVFLAKMLGIDSWM